jgi:hypothetical protein
MNYFSKFLAALVALLAMATITSRQIFVSLSAAERSFHLWLALGPGIKAVVDRLIEMTMENVPREVIPKTLGATS